MTENELKLWIEKMRDGNPDAFEVIYNQTKENVYRTVTFLVINKEDVHDVVNEVYMKMLKSISTYDLNRSFTKWLHGIVVHQVMDWRRNIWRRLRTIKRKKEMEVEELVDSYSSIIKREMKDELLTVLQRLSTKLRVVIVLRYYLY